MFGAPRRRLPWQLRTKFSLSGVDEVEQFRAICYLLERRPHQLVDDLVRDGISQLMAEPEFADTVSNLVAISRNNQSKKDIEELNAIWEVST